MNNIDSRATEADRIAVLSEICQTMEHSGYPATTRLEVLKGVVNIHQQMEQEVAEGKIPRWRSGQQILAHKKRNQLRHKDTWFQRGDHTTTI